MLINGKDIPVEFPVLYTFNVREKPRIWKINVIKSDDQSIIEMIAGEENGKMMTNKTIIKCGKNIGKKNETTHYQQALLEAYSKWTKKKEQGGTITKENNKVEIKPMLIHKYTEKKKHIQFPAYVQPKLDGIRTLINMDTTDNVIFKSRGNTYYKNFNKQSEELKKFLKQGIYLDGELYYHNNDIINFNILTGLCRKSKDITTEERKLIDMIEFHIFDVFIVSQSSLTFSERLQWINDNVPTTNLIKKVDTRIVNTASELLELFNIFLEDDYEGIVIRNKKGIYDPRGNRSLDVLKYKEFCDDEFKIVGFEEGIGKDIGSVKWICEIKCPCKDCEKNNGIYHFTVRPARDLGKIETRRELFKNADKYIGQYLTVRYQNTANYAHPRFGQGIAIRNYE